MEWGNLSEIDLQTRSGWPSSAASTDLGETWEPWERETEGEGITIPCSLSGFRRSISPTFPRVPSTILRWIIRRLRTSESRGVLFVPEWRTADYWTEIFDRKGNLLWPFRFIETHKPFIIQGIYNSQSPLSGRVKFNFLAIEFDSE